jgi:hypothetical protein
MVIKTLPYRFKFPENRMHVQCLFRYIACGIFLFFIFLSCQNYVHAQVQVTGHVMAEIVEPTSLSSKAFNSHLIEENNTASNNELVLARVKLNSGQDMNVDVAIKTSHLVASNGDIIPFDAFVCPICSEDDSGSFTGDKIFTLKALPGESILPKRGNNFSGGYSMVFMYN